MTFIEETSNGFRCQCGLDMTDNIMKNSRISGPHVVQLARIKWDFFSILSLIFCV